MKTRGFMKKSLIYAILLGSIALSGVSPVPTNNRRAYAVPTISRASIAAGYSAFADKITSFAKNWFTPLNMTALPTFEPNKTTWLKFTGLAAIGSLFMYRYFKIKQQTTTADKETALLDEIDKVAFTSARSSFFMTCTKHNVDLTFHTIT